MASNKIELDVGGKYSAGDVFKQWDSDLKKAGKGMKDMGGAATSVANNIAGAFDSKLNGSLKSSLGILQEMARGGIWGAMTAVANTAISYIADKIVKAKEEAKKFADILRTGIVDAMKVVGGNFSNVSKEIDETTAKAKEMLAVVNGKVASSAELKIHEINTKALQSITDEMTNATKTALLATAALEQAEVKAAATVEQAANTTANAQANLDAAAKKREAAEKALSDAQAQRAEFEQQATMYGTGWLAKYKDLQDRASMSMEELMSTGMALETALKFRKSAALTLANFEEEHKNEIASMNEVTKLEGEAKKAVEQAKRSEEQATNALTVATQNESVARASTADSVAQAKLKQDEANAALEKETIAKQNAALAEEREIARQNVLDQLKCEMIEKDIDYNEHLGYATKLLENGYSAETTLTLTRMKYNRAMEEQTAEEERQIQLNKAIDTIKCECIENDLEYTQYTDLVTKALQEGYSIETALNVARARYKDELGKARLLDESTPLGGGSAIITALKDALNGITVNVNTAGVGDGVDKSNQIVTLGGLQREVRDEQRQARDRLDVLKQSSNAMQQYMQGKMSPEVAAKFQEKLKSLGITKSELDIMTQKAWKAQLLSKSKQEQQADAVEEIKNKLEKMGLQ